VFIDTTFKTLGTVETEHSQEFQESLTGDYPALYIQFSGLIAVSTVCLVLLSNCAHSTDAGLKHSTPQIHFHTCSSTYATQWLAVTQLSVSCYLQALFIAYCMSQTYFTLLVTAGIPRMFCLLLVQEGSSSLDIRGCMGRHSTGCCCPLLQYRSTFSLLCSRWGPTTVFLMTWYPHFWISWGLFHAQWWLVDAEHTITHEISYVGCLYLVIHIIVSVEDSCLEAEVCSINGGIII
jgi:hypothetical protein